MESHPKVVSENKSRLNTASSTLLKKQNIYNKGQLKVRLSLTKIKTDSPDARGASERTGFVNLKMATLRTDPVAGFNCLMGNYREDGPRLFSKASNEKTNGNRDQSQEGKIPVIHQEKTIRNANA